ncbi:ABC transporter permease subunit [Myxococcota bacterium]|nr:ABC transporter permease subunit [Myxococcota bacterium]
MTAIRVIAANTFRQTVRQRLFYNIAIFGVGMLLFSMVLGQVTFGYPDRVVRSIGLSGVNVALNLIALFISVSLIHQEIDTKTLFVVLTRPVHRWQYVVGRYLGLVLTLALTLLGLAIVFVITLVLARGTPQTQDVLAVAAALPEAAILAGIGTVLSTYSTPTLSGGLGLGLWIASTATDDLLRLTEKAEPLTRIVARGAYYLLPSLSRLDFRDFAVYQTPIELADWLAAVSYGALYSVVLVALASAILQRREMM